MNEKAETEPLQILLVEDNSTDALLIEEMLEEVRGAEITLTHVKRLDEALARLKAEYFDAVLLDLSLPDCSGLETLTRTQSSYPKVPILILSGWDDETLALTAVRDGAQEYLVKGRLDSIMLARAIRYAIERKRTEQKLMDSEERYRRLFEATQDGIFILDADSGQIIDANPALEALLGYTRREFIGKRLWEIAPFRDKAANQAAFATLQKKGSLRYEDLPLATKSGQFIDVEFVGNVHEVGSHRVVQCNIRDISERKLVEQELRESNEKFHLLANNISETFWIRSADMREQHYISPSYERIWGRPAAAQYANPHIWSDFIVPEDRARVVAAYAELMRDTPSISVEYHIMRPDGELRWVHARGFQVRNDAGELIRLTGLTSDITSRKESEEALRTSMDRFQSIVANVPGLVYQLELQPDGFVHWPFVSEGFQEIFEASPEILQHDPRWPINQIHPDERHDFDRSVAASQEMLMPRSWEGRLRLASGTTKWIQITSRPQRLADGGTLWNGLIMDITARKEAEAALQKANDKLELHVLERTAQLRLANEQLESEMLERRRADASLYKNHEFLQAILENTTEGIVACDAAGQLTFFNRATREFHGLPLEQLPAEQWSQHYSLYFPDGSTPMQKEDVPLCRALNGEHIRDIEMVIAPRDGSTRLVINNGEPLFDHSGQKLGAVIVMHDITSRKQAEETLRLEVIERETALRALSEAYEVVQQTNEKAEQARLEAERANLAKSEFLSRMSHELRTPLNAILGFGQILAMRSQGSTPQQQDHIQQILKAGRHLLDLINEVLDIARIEAGRLSLSPEPTAVGVLVREALDMAHSLAQTKGIDLLDALCEEHSLQYVLADGQRLKQVLLNLLSNAVKYNREQGRVIVSCEISDGEPIIYNGVSCAGRLRLMIQDTGLGLAPEDIARLFVPFERLSAGQTRIEGSGIGLSICKSLIEAMHGRIGVESQIGQGSTFWLELPRVDAAFAQHSPLAANAPSHQIFSETSSAELSAMPIFDGARSILYIEDNLSNIRLIRHVLTDFNDQVQLITAMQGTLGLELAASHRPDLILLDVNLPDIMGGEVLARLQANPVTADIPVVALSADATPRQSERMLAAGATHYLTKPLDIKEFLNVLQQTFNPNNNTPHPT